MCLTNVLAGGLDLSKARLLANFKDKILNDTNILYLTDNLRANLSDFVRCNKVLYLNYSGLKFAPLTMAALKIYALRSSPKYVPLCKAYFKTQSYE